MTIRTDAFSLCKEIHRWEFRQRVKGLLHRINTTTDERTRKGDDYGELGYYGRTQNLEILGYLAVNAKADAIRQLPIPISTRKLPGPELEVLETAHRFIADTVQQCAAALDDQLPGLSTAIHPYSLTPYTFQTQAPAAAQPETTQVIESFKKHPGFTTAGNAIKKVPQIKKLPPKTLMSATQAAEQKVAKHGLHGAPSEMREIALQPANPQVLMTQFLFSLVALKASLRTLAHLTYQAFRFEKLVVLDNDNVFEIDNQSSTALGQSLGVMAQPNGIELFPHAPVPGDIVLAKLKLEHAEFDGEWLTCETGWSFSRDFGDSLRIGARKLDDNLNPYYRIIPPF